MNQRNSSSWAETIQHARALTTRWDLHLIADVMDEIAHDWEGVVEAYIGIGGAYFRRQGDHAKGSRPEVRMVLSSHGRSQEDDVVFEFRYFGDVGRNALTAADRCRRPNAAAVLTAFLHNLSSPESEDQVADGG